MGGVVTKKEKLIFYSRKITKAKDSDKLGKNRQKFHTFLYEVTKKKRNDP